MAMSVIWTVMVVVSVACGLLTGRGDAVAAAALEAGLTGFLNGTPTLSWRNYQLSADSIASDAQVQAYEQALDRWKTTGYVQQQDAATVTLTVTAEDPAFEGVADVTLQYQFDVAPDFLLHGGVGSYLHLCRR